MNLTKLFLFALALVVAMSACSDDDEGTPSCDQSSWVGTYTGTVTCDGDSEDVTVTITADGTEAIIIVYETTGLTATYDPITPDGCNIDITSSDAGITLSVDADLNGNNLSFTEVFSTAGTSSTCLIEATRN